MGKKISQLTAISGGTFSDADLFEISVSSGGAFVSRKITGAEIKATIPSGITINSTTVTSGTSGRVLFENTGVVKESANFYWDDTNARLSIGMGSSPTAMVDIKAGGSSSSDYGLRVRNSAATKDLLLIRGNGDHELGSTTSPSLSLIASSGYSYPGLTFVGQGGTEKSQIYMTSNRMTFLHTTSNTATTTMNTTGIAVGFGDTGASARIDIKAQGALSTDLALRVRNSANTQNLLSVAGNGSFTLGLSGSYYISLDSTSPSLRGYNASTIAWQLSPWTGEHSWLTSNQTNQNLIGIGTTTPTDKLHISNTVNHSKIRIGMLASNPADESTGIRFTTTWCGGSFGSDAVNIIARTKGSASTASQKTTLEFSLNAAGTTAIKASITSQSNFLLGNPTEDTSDAGIIYVVSGTAPSASVTDGYKQYSADIVAGNAAPHFRTEAGDIIKLYKETTAVTSATITSPGAGSNIKSDDTFDGYTLAQVVKALRNLGILA